MAIWRCMQHSFLGASFCSHNFNKRSFLYFHHCIRLVAGETILSTIMDLLLLSLFVLLSLVEVQSHDVPYFMFETAFIANHSYMDPSLLELSGDTSIQCHSDKSSCCQGNPYRGHWYFPNGSMVQNLQNSESIYYLGVDQRVDLRRRSAPLPTSAEGIYCCEVPTFTSESERAYVGLYSSGGSWC